MRKAGGLAAALFFSAAALAQTGAPWNSVPGTARDLAIAPSGEVYAAGAAGNLWRWRAEDGVWVPVPGNAARIAAGPGGALWAVSAEGAVMRYGHGGWETLSGPKARDLALDAQGEVYVAREDGSLARWNAATRAWMPIPGRAHRLAVASDGAIWTLAEDGAIARIVGEQVEPVPGRARDLAAGPNDVVAASAEGRLERWNAGARAWEEVPGAPGDVAQVALAPDGVAWVARPSGAILTQAPVKRELALSSFGTNSSTPEGVTFGRGGMRGGGYYGGGTGYYGGYRSPNRAAGAAVVIKPPAATTDPAPFEFVDTFGTASSLAIGQDGSVFAIALDGNLTRWSNSRRAFVPFPGSVVRVAVDPAGNPWGINQAGRIFRHTGTDWRQVRGTASDLAIAARGPIMAASASGALSVYDPPTESFLPVQGELYFIALEPEGVLWGLLRDGSVLRCPSTPCERMGVQARNISIGPDGSVFIVNFANELRRFNQATSLFDYIPVPGHVPASVAVGPFGRPWVVTTTGKVLSSRFFDRDEELDQKTAAATVTPTTGTGDAAAVLGGTTTGTGFTFSKAMKFTEVGVPCAVGEDVAIGVDGTVIVICDGGTRILRYNPNSKNLVDLTNLPTSAIVAVDVDAEGRLWLVDGIMNGRIYRQRAKNSSAWDTLQVPVTSAGIACDIAIGPDGTVYYIDATLTLYRKTAADAKFSKMINGTFFGVAVGLANDVWVRTLSDLYQIVGGQLEKRPLTGSPSTFDIGGGADGSIYATQMHPNDSLPMLYKWNASNRSFDRVTQTATRVDVAPNGRPWIYNSSQGRLFFAR